MIVDCLGMSVDSLFGRTGIDYADLQMTLRRKIVELDVEERLYCAFEMCLKMEKVLFSAGEDTKNG